MIRHIAFFSAIESMTWAKSKPISWILKIIHALPSAFHNLMDEFPVHPDFVVHG
jgi:hypothetical protein